MSPNPANCSMRSDILFVVDNHSIIDFEMLKGLINRCVKVVRRNFRVCTRINRRISWFLNY